MHYPAKPRPCTEAGLAAAAVITVFGVAVIIYWVRDLDQLEAWRSELDVGFHSAMATVGVHFALKTIAFVPLLARFAWRGITSVARAVAGSCVCAWRLTATMVRAATAWCARHIEFHFKFKLDFGESRSA